MHGYIQDDGSLIPGVDASGWFHTKDSGTLQNGWLHITGRVDNMFISGGENIHPEEIERALMGLDGVHAAIVVAIPSTTWGQRPVAFVRSTHSAAALKQGLRAVLAGFQVPDHIHPWPEDAPGWDGKPPRRWFTDRARSLSMG